MNFLNAFNSSSAADDILPTDASNLIISLIIDEEKEDVCQKKIENILKKNSEKNDPIDMNTSIFNNETEQYQTALSACFEKGWNTLGSFLLKNGSQPNIVFGEDDWTPLFVCAEHGNIKGLQLLIEHGADLQYQDRSGWSCLFVACGEGQYECVSFLLEKGVNCLLENEDGKKAIDFSQTDEIEELIKEHLQSGKGKDLMIDTLQEEIKKLKRKVKRLKKVNANQAKLIEELQQQQQNDNNNNGERIEQQQKSGSIQIMKKKTNNNQTNIKTNEHFSKFKRKKAKRRTSLEFI